MLSLGIEPGLRGMVLKISLRKNDQNSGERISFEDYFC